MMHNSSVVVKITAWYDWLLLVLVLALGAYTCKCLDYYLSSGVQNALSVRAREISSLFAVTGQLFAGQGRDPGPELKDLFISVGQVVPLVDEMSEKGKNGVVSYGTLRHSPNPLAVPRRVVRRSARVAGFLTATARSAFGGKEYVVEVRQSRKAISAVFRQTAITMLIGLLVGLAMATLGSFFFVKRALIPLQKIALAVRDMPIIHPNERLKDVAALKQIEKICFTVNEMTGRLEDSFQTGVGLPAEALRVPGNQLGTVRGELANFFENQRFSIDVAKALLSLLSETERLSDISRNLAAPSGGPSGQKRTERLRFYLGGLAASGTENVCALSKRLEADLMSEARTLSNEDSSFQW
jgi:hypothetical protein